jgi:predicted enzyme related to lactoylglutathione lyase
MAQGKASKAPAHRAEPGSLPIIGFVATADFGRAKAFYQDVLRLPLRGEDEFALVFESAGIMIRVVNVGKFTPYPFTVLGWKVDDIAATVRILAKRGVVFQRFPGMRQNAAGIWSAPGGARVAWFKDADGNLLSLSQHP